MVTLRLSTVSYTHLDVYKRQAFKLPMICGKKEDVESVKDLSTYAQLVEKLRTERPESSITGAFNATQELKQLLLVNSSSLLEDRKLNTHCLSYTSFFPGQRCRPFSAACDPAESGHKDPPARCV